MPISNKDIAQYYDTNQVFYTYFWSRTALHYGFWYEETKSIAEAVLNTNRFVLNALGIDSNDTILDAGCGVGGTGIYLAETTGARLEGITLSDVQLNMARRRAASSAAASLLSFSKQDFCKTSFGENTFSKIFGIESICHAERKIDFLLEAYRIMRPGGRIAIVDFFLNKDNLDMYEMEIYKKTIEGWVIPNFATPNGFTEFLEQAGFKNVAFHNMLNHIRKSSKKIYYRKLLLSPFDFLKYSLGIGRKDLSSLYQKAFFDNGIGTYGVFVATKPER